jgi:Family of unknown function (DUF6345)
MQLLPIYHIETKNLSNIWLDDAKRTLIDYLGIKEHTVGKYSNRLTMTSKNYSADVDIHNGSIWLVNPNKLWHPNIETRLPTKNAALKASNEFFKSNEHIIYSSVEKNIIDIQVLEPLSSYLSVLDIGTDTRTDIEVDYRIRYQKLINLEEFDYNGEESRIPILGPYGKVGITVTGGEDIVAFNTMTKLIDPHLKSELIPRTTADKHFKDLTTKLDIESYDVHLCYVTQTDPSNPVSKFLTPHWGFNSYIKIKDRIFPNKVVLVPATEFGSKIARYGLHTNTKERNESFKSGSSEKVNIGSSYKVGVSWIGTIGRLPMSEANANGFISSLEHIGWNCVFNQGDCQAWISSWVKDDDAYVDNVHIAYYVGHCEPGGWYLVNSSNCEEVTLTPSDPGSSPSYPGDQWGEKDLNWIVLSGCGPLEDNIISPGGGDALNRWKGGFDGLHSILGYGSTTFENEVEGETFVRYASEGQTIINAWLRAGIEIQPSINRDIPPYGPNTYVSAMWATNSTADPYDDHLLGYGAVSADPSNPYKISCIWVPC